MNGTFKITTRRAVLTGGAAAFSVAGNAARAADVHYTTPGLVPPLRQPSDMKCWATVATMMYSWKKGGSYDIDTVMAAAGGGFESAFKANQGLKLADKPALLSKLGLHAEAPQSFSIPGWVGLMKSHGPLWVTTNEAAKPYFAVHARIVTAIDGDGSPERTSFTIVDPADGAVKTESIKVFVDKFEALANSYDLQVVHY